MRKYRMLLALTVICALVSAALSMTAPYFLGEAVDSISKSPSDGDFVKYIIILAVLYAFGALFQWAVPFLSAILSGRTVEAVRNDAFEKLQKLPLRFFDTNKHGDIMSRITNDIENISDGLTQCLSQIISGSVTICGIIVFMFCMNVWIALLVLVITPLSVFVAKFVVIRSAKLFSKQQYKTGEMNGFAEEIISAYSDVAAYGLGDKMISEFRHLNEELYAVGQKAQFASGQINPSTRLVNHIAYISVGVAGGIASAAYGLSIGRIASFLTYATQFAKPINDIAGVTTQIQSAIASAERVSRLISEEEEYDEPCGTPTMSEMSGSCKGSVCFEDMSFSYVPERPLIKDLSISVKPGELCAIVGPTGAGKTTLVNLLMRFYDATGGKILIDGIDINSVTRKSVRGLFTMVLQDTWLFEGTVRENITYACDGASEEDVIRAAKAAHAHSFIKRLPNGYDTVLREGDGLSAGQRQLLTIARAMLPGAPMLILDEATSSVDVLTEQSIQRSFREMMKGRTSFVIAHRLSTVRNADIILVMDNGNIAEYGTHEELMSHGGLYSELVRSGYAT